jgi:hypothetical protein
LATLTLTPSPDTLAIGGTRQFAVVGKDSSGNVLALSPSPTWSVVSGGGTISSSGMFTDNSTVGLPYGSGAEEHGITATVVRRISERVRLTVRYGYYHSEDELSGGNNDYEAHVLFSSLQYRF